MKTLNLIIGLCCFLVQVCTSMENPGEVKTTNGLVSGFTKGDIRIFKGIPFARPPVGDLRWKAPQPVKNWDGVKECKAFGPSPMQAKPVPFMFWSSEFLIPEDPIDEDCLYLNVWTRAEQAGEKRPVLVFIYGGGFRSGGSGCPIYDGESMAKKGVVFVSINYRVGPFGFLAHPELSEESESGTSGNYGILDMIAALHWVKDNISAFGGDPGNVTIAGQSAGAFGVNFLTASPLASGLFHRAIAQSGGSFYSDPLRERLTMKDAEAMGVDFAEGLDAESIEELRNKPAEEIHKTQNQLSWPIEDGYVLSRSIYETYATGHQNDIPLLLGWNENDIVMGLPLQESEFRERIETRFGQLSQTFYDAYPMNTQEEVIEAQFNMNRDETFGIQVRTWAKLQTKTGQSQVYLYNFNREVPSNTPQTQFGAFHSGEIVYAYDNLHTLDRPWKETDYQIAKTMSEYWVNFALTGNPNGDDLPVWKQYNDQSESVLIIDTQTKSQKLPTSKKLDFWEQYFKKTIN